MPSVMPFRAIRYNPTKVDLNSVVAPPYDVISPQEQEALYNKDRYNVVRLILGREKDRYASAAHYYKEWLRSGVLFRDAEPAVYCLVQSFELDGKKIQRKGIIVRCRLEEFDKMIVLPHEKTLSKPKEDRLRLMETTRANFSQIFAFYVDPQRTIDAVLETDLKRNPLIEATFGGVENAVWSITRAEAVSAVTSFLLDKEVFIADGHHRYETGLLYRDAQKTKNRNHTGHEPYNYTMMYLTNMEGPGLVILPTHRVVRGIENFDPQAFVKRLGEYCNVETYSDLEKLTQALRGRRERTFGMLIAGDSRLYLIRLRDEEDAHRTVNRTVPDELAGLDITLLHSAILDNILGISPEAQVSQTNLSYAHDANEVLSKVRSGDAQLGFLVNPTRIEQVRSAALAGHALPQKSTYFYPKLLSGLLMNRLEEQP